MTPLPIFLLSVAQPLEFNGAELAGALLLLAIVASLIFWGAMLQRYRARGSILANEPRRHVPWQGIDVIVVLVAFVLLSAIAASVLRWWLGPGLFEPKLSYEPLAPSTDHPVVEALATGGLWMVLLCVFAVVVVAPIAEEFLFRVLLQGWLESCVARWARYLPNLRRRLPGASGPILLSSLLFAKAHFRVAGPRYRADSLAAMLLANTVVGLLLVCFAVSWLRWRTGATAADLGLVPGKPACAVAKLGALAGDVRLGLWSLVGLLGPIYAVHIACHVLLPEYLAPDPIPLFFLAIGLGVLYARTHRLAPCVVLHAALNATSLALAWASSYP